MKNSPQALIYKGDAAAVLSHAIASESVDCTFTSPPYFGKFDYQVAGQLGHSDGLPEYLDRLRDVFALVYQATVPGGSCFINLAPTWNNYSVVRSRYQETKSTALDNCHRRRLESGYQEKELINIPGLVTDALRAIGWLHRDTFIWVKPGQGKPTGSDRPAMSYESILYFRKPTGSKRYYPSYWDGSHLPSTMIKAPVARHPVHPCAFLPHLVQPFILASCPPGGLVLDPFCGVGTTVVTALACGRRGVGIELHPKFAQIARNAIASIPANPANSQLIPV